MTNVVPVNKMQRFIDPNASLKAQWSVLVLLIKDPPENSRIVTICPELAQQILEKMNTNNRRQRPNKIKLFAEDMAAGEWRLTGDTIKFSRLGVLLDGQNRLAACVRAGVAFRTYVAFGIDDDAFKVIDTNSVRTNADTFKIAGVPYERLTSGAVRWVMIYGSPFVNGCPNRSLSFSNGELWNYYKTHIDENAMAWAARQAYNIKGVPQQQLAGHLYMFCAVDRPATEAFAADLEKYQGGGKKLIDCITELRKAHMKFLHETPVNARLILAWKAYRDEKSVTAKVLKWTDANVYPTIG